MADVKSASKNARNDGRVVESDVRYLIKAMPDRLNIRARGLCSRPSSAVAILRWRILLKRDFPSRNQRRHDVAAVGRIVSTHRGPIAVRRGTVPIFSNSARRGHRKPRREYSITTKLDCVAFNC